MPDTLYSVHVEAQAPPGSRAAVDDGAADELMDLLEDHSGIVAAGEGSWSVTVSVPADDVRMAAAKGVALIEEMAAKAGMPSWALTRSETLRQDILEADNALPTMPEIVSVPEAADILGVSQQRVRELASTQPGFPEPVYELRTGKLWLRAAIEAYAARRSRKPGRPAKEHVEASTAPALIGSLHSRSLWDPSPVRDFVLFCVVVSSDTEPGQMHLWTPKRSVSQKALMHSFIVGYLGEWHEPHAEEVEDVREVLSSWLHSSR